MSGSPDEEKRVIERQLPLTNTNRWFEKRRDFFTRQLVEDFFRVKFAFQETYLVYLECRTPGELDCSGLLDEQAVEQRRQLWDHLVRMVGSENEKGPLWHLKDLCHMVWPGVEHEHDASGSLFDWLVGSIFHETMKLKENIYLLDRYGPAACRIKERPLEVGSSVASGVHTRPEHSMESIVDVQGLIKRAAGYAVNQIEYIAFLFNHAAYMLRLKMAVLSKNDLIVRFLIEQEEKVRHLWGEEIEEVLQDMFFGDVVEGFCVAGRSYQDGQWFNRALEMYKRALAVDPQCDEAITKTAQLQSVIRENRELLVA